MAGLLSERGLVFLGNGGADKDIVDMLERLPESALPHGIYWVAENWPATAVGDWLADRRNVTWVTSGDFDELMLLVRHEFALPHPKIDPIQAVFEGYSKTFADLSQKVLGLSPDEPSSVPLREARERAVAEMDDWWAFEIRAREFKDTNPDRTDQIYREGLEAFPESKELLNNYASFLTGIRGEHDRAEEFYRRAMEVDPNQATILSNYAKLLTNVRGDHDGAEEHYRRALEADPNYVTALGNYAIFLETVRGDHDGAEEHYKRALELDPNHANALGGYALFLRSVRGDNAGAEEYFLRAIEADPDHANNLGNYAGFLLGLGRLEEGLDLLTRAMSNSEFPTNFELQAECWFYLYANGPADRRDEALIELKRVLADGGRSAGWDLSANIVRAIKDDHPAGDWIAKLAAVIADEAEIQSLDDWDDWAKA